MNTAGKKILVIDNHDSFVFNIVQYLNELGAQTTTVLNDSISANFAADFDGVLISPGPGTPESAGVSIEVIKYCAENKIPVLGVCLGLQAIAVNFGGKVSSAPDLIHGRTSPIEHNGENIFREIPNQFNATRYHSLAIENNSIPVELEVTATTEDGTIMGIAHKTLNIVGVQFHPEAVLTEYGYQILANWLELCGDIGARNRAAGFTPLVIN